MAELRPGIDGTNDTLAVMSEYARTAAARIQQMGGLARLSASKLPKFWMNHDAKTRALLLREFLSRNVRFLEDPPGTELVRHPLAMLNEWGRADFMQGDCDDVATLGAALALAMGLEARWRVVRFTKRQDFEHVYTEVKPRGFDWMELDVFRPAGIDARALIAESQAVEL